MPSDIARLTYGYLLETNCVRTAQLFLDESPYLREFAQGIKSGYQYSTKPYNMSLVETLNGKFSRLGTIQPVQTMMDFPNITTYSYDNLYHQTNVKDGITMESQPRNVNHLSTPKHKILQSRNLNAYSPRRKSATPKRLLNQHPYQRQQQQFHSDLSVHCRSSDPIQQVASSSPISSMACESSEIDIEVQPQIIFDELLKYRPLQDKVANTIQKIIDVKDNPNDVQNVNQQQENDESIKRSEELKSSADSENKIGDIENDLLPIETMDELLSSLADEPEFQDFVHIVVEKEIANTPFKSIHLNTPSCTSNSSLNTPNMFMTPTSSEQNSKVKNQSQVMPVKNLINELKTPDRGSVIANRSNNTSSANECITTNTTTITNNNNPAASSCTKIKPIFQNHNFVSKFSRINNKQKEVQEALKNCSATMNNNNNTFNKNNDDKKALTTTIELVNGGGDDDDNDDDNNKPKPAATMTTQATAQTCPPQSDSNVEVLSIQNWSAPNTNLTQPVIIPNNQTIAWSDQQGVVYLSYPTTTATTTQETIYYIDSSNINHLSSALTTNAITTCSTDTVITDTKPTINLPTAVVVDNHQSMMNPSIVQEESTQQSKQNSRIESLRAVPSILSKGKRHQRISDSQNRQIQTNSSTIHPPSNQQVLTGNHQSQSTNRRKSDMQLQKISSHNHQQQNNVNQQKRRISASSDDSLRNSKRASMVDKKVEKILGSNIEEFLVNYHNKKDRQGGNLSK